MGRMGSDDLVPSRPGIFRFHVRKSFPTSHKSSCVVQVEFSGLSDEPEGGGALSGISLEFGV